MKSPPLPPLETVNRGDFIGVKVSLTPPAGLGVDNAVVEFGYDENFNSVVLEGPSAELRAVPNPGTWISHTPPPASEAP